MGGCPSGRDRGGEGEIGAPSRPTYSGRNHRPDGPMQSLPCAVRPSGVGATAAVGSAREPGQGDAGGADADGLRCSTLTAESKSARSYRRVRARRPRQTAAPEPTGQLGEHTPVEVDMNGTPSGQGVVVGRQTVKPRRVLLRRGYPRRSSLPGQVGCGVRPLRAASSVDGERGLGRVERARLRP